MHQSTGRHFRALFRLQRRDDFIVEFVKGKVVLDCGCVDHWAYLKKLESGCWLHTHLRRHAKSVVGVDILVDAMRQLKGQLDLTLVAADAEALPFGQHFDVVVAGELLEHLHNAGAFLEQAWGVLRPNGLLLVSTPNNFSLSKLTHAVFRGIEVCHPEHTCYYSVQTLSYLLHEHGFRVSQIHLLPRPARSRILELLYGLVAKFRPILAEVIVVAAEKGHFVPKYLSKW